MTFIPQHQKLLFGLGAALASYGITSLTPDGNGLIAVYVTALVLGIRRGELREVFAQRADETVEIVKLLIFVVFGSLLSVSGLFHDGWAAVGVVAATLLVARPVAVAVALAGTSTTRRTRAFMAWFGPKGVATMTFALLVLGDRIAARQRIFDLAALAVFTSIIAHGLTDTAGTRWIARQPETSRRRAASASAGAGATAGLVAAPSRVKQPAHEDGQENEGREAENQRQEHAHNISDERPQA